MPRVSFLFAWYDLWIGAYWDRKGQKLYLLPVPMFGIVLDFSPRALLEKQIKLAAQFEDSYVVLRDLDILYWGGDSQTALAICADDPTGKSLIFEPNTPAEYHRIIRTRGRRLG